VNRYICSDLHLGHKNICKYRDEFISDESHDLFIKKGLEEVDGKKSMIFFLGDIALDYESLEFISKLKARKVLICGNHDLDRQVNKMSDLVEVYDDVYGLYKYKGFWLSHAPIHPCELRGKKNIHGHTHRYLMLDSESKVDNNYVNVSMDYMMHQYRRPAIEFNEAVSESYQKNCKTQYNDFILRKKVEL
jgi:calcineurin-like phosphoesterase family protein